MKRNPFSCKMSCHFFEQVLYHYEACFWGEGTSKASDRECQRVPDLGDKPADQADNMRNERICRKAKGKGKE